MKTKPRADIYKIIIVGVGGTGGLLSRDLARYLYSIKNNENISYELALVDGDRVSLSNVSRQPFLNTDVGQFKVDCLSEAFDVMYDIPVVPFPTYLDNCDDLRTIVKTLKPKSFSTFSYDIYKHIVLVGGVDNHRARQVLHSFYNTYPISTSNYEDIYYIDSANEFDFGTCICGYRNAEGEYCPPRAFFFPDILTDKGKRASEISCGEINVSSPQHLITNLFAANVLLARIISFITKHETLFGVTTFFPFQCQISHRNAASYGVNNYHELWLKEQQKQGGDINVSAN